ncbi:ParB N-terminal domain-containing protein [Microbacterium sp. 18062]|uniref:ParB N-terminal domain-containing protein n=1 Tax=Microbacterium sp. 18062 TaxID=2681410 RepID=UPI00135CDEBD|nr:ParB N-terminal domain-containing protein [Microbacterium sp. 18062]
MARGHLLMEQAIGQIRRGSQYRRDPDEDLDELCGSLERVGILNPPAITEGSVLITGNRRLAAMERLGWRVTPVWVVPDVSDKLSYVLAIRDEQTLQKALKPLEQAELYEELKALYAEDAQRRDAATRFGSPDRNDRVAEVRDGGAESAPPSGGGKVRVQAARAVTGRDSRTMLEQINELRRIAADDLEDPYVRQEAAEALIELNTDGKVNGRYLHVKSAQNLAGIRRAADDPDAPETVRASAKQELQTLEKLEQPAEVAKESSLALARLTQLRESAGTAERIGWKDADPLLREKHQIRKLVDLLRREHGWWDRFDPTDFGRHAEPDQWELVDTYITAAATFLATARTAREETADADV